MSDGAELDFAVGEELGTVLGPSEGEELGTLEGALDGNRLGIMDGDELGRGLGLLDGDVLGPTDGSGDLLGFPLGEADGAADGTSPKIHSVPHPRNSSSEARFVNGCSHVLTNVLRVVSK